MPKKPERFSNFERFPLNLSEFKKLKFSNDEHLRFENFFSLHGGCTTISIVEEALLFQEYIKLGIVPSVDTRKWDISKMTGVTAVDKRKFRKVANQVFAIVNYMKSIEGNHLPRKRAFSKESFLKQKKYYVRDFLLMNVVLRCIKEGISDEFRHLRF